MPKTVNRNAFTLSLKPTKAIDKELQLYQKLKHDKINSDFRLKTFL